MKDILKVLVVVFLVSFIGYAAVFVTYLDFTPNDFGFFFENLWSINSYCVIGFSEVFRSVKFLTGLFLVASMMVVLILDLEVVKLE